MQIFKPPYTVISLKPQERTAVVFTNGWNFAAVTLSKGNIKDKVPEEDPNAIAVNVVVPARHRLITRDGDGLCD